MLLLLKIIMFFGNGSLYGMDIKPAWYYGAAGDMKKKFHQVQLESGVHENLQCKLGMQLSKIADKYMIFHGVQKVHSPHKDKKQQRNFRGFLLLLKDLKTDRALEIKTIVSQDQLKGVVKRWHTDDNSLEMQIKEQMKQYQSRHNKKKKVHPKTLSAVQALEKTLSPGV
jgi:phosphoribosyl-AMP cyclohydrolase